MLSTPKHSYFTPATPDLCYCHAPYEILMKLEVQTFRDAVDGASNKFRTETEDFKYEYHFVPRQQLKSSK